MAMSPPILYVAITNHGFGHATRTASVAAAIQRLCPEILLILVTTAPRWLLNSYLQGNFIHRPRAFDVGVVQTDGLTMDRAATLEQLRLLRDRQNSLIAQEVNFIRQNRVGLVLADIPPLAVAIAKKAEIPCWMSSNFGWDLIYGSWGGEFVEIAHWISDCFAQCDRLFRLPFHEPMSSFKSIIDVGLTGGSPRYNLDELRATWGLTAPKEQTILLTFGGLGLQQVPYGNLKRFPDWQFITFDGSAPDLPNLIKISDRKYRPVDFMPLCGRLVSKPGYGTFAEAVRQRLPIVTMTRQDFAEAAFLLAGISEYSQHQILSSEEFFQSNWEFLHQSPQMSQKSQPIAADGNEAIAQAVVSYFRAS
ncbi:MAG: glycosyl transferase [Chroococcidiopsidaceae cyanobacterium CP_BM_ER_R8_30]|nr:glycosyl transferase [Chroococcidiopsidaceae cyanobacterium CP_BM_ER_R8_30]